MNIKFKVFRRMCKSHITFNSAGSCDYCDDYANAEHHNNGSCRKKLCFVYNKNYDFEQEDD